ncbi:carboxymuconolactone decarboxylase family protein [Streptomyces sp. NPDC021020]|uniref:carboxymuconolactone decarboxylase family protein n=1 Tax=Streptomyces sp. NPDC021020 TaxID=3365109 RepID=UPI003787914E
MFAAHTLESAPPESQPAMRAVKEEFGVLPDAVGRLAHSPELLNGFLALSAGFESGTLDALSQETVAMAVSVRNQCHICIGIHTARLRKLPAPPEVIAALREARPLPDPRLEALRTFTLATMATAGAVEDATLNSLLAHGYTERNALEVVLGIGVYTLTTLANRLTGAV